MCSGGMQQPMYGRPQPSGSFQGARPMMQSPQGGFPMPANQPQVSSPFQGGVRPMAMNQSPMPGGKVAANPAMQARLNAFQQQQPMSKGLVLSEGPKAGFGGQNPDFSPMPPPGTNMPPAGPAYLYGTTAGMFGAPQSPDPRMMYNLGAKSWGLVPGYNGYTGGQ